MQSEAAAGMTADNEGLTATVDWTAAVWAGVLAGAISFLLYLFLVPALVGSGNAWAMMRYIASIPMGPDVLAPPATFDGALMVAALGVHFALAIIMALVIAFVLHRGGMVTGILGGAVFGLIFFAINYYTMTLFFPHLFAMSHWTVVAIHVIFGALAGGIYELLELEPGERLPAAKSA
jgi:hypothetical protein